MAVKHTTASVILSVSIALIVFVSFSCTKPNTTTAVATVPTTLYANIDSMIGHYSGTTSGDSVYTYIDSNGKTQQWVHSYSMPDTIVVTSPDTMTIKVTSKFYTTTFYYADSLTIATINETTGIGDTLTQLRNIVSPGQFTSFNDTASAINHLTLTLGYSGAKGITSNMYLYSR